MLFPSQGIYEKLSVQIINVNDEFMIGRPYSNDTKFSSDWCVHVEKTFSDFMFDNNGTLKIL